MILLIGGYKTKGLYTSPPKNNITKFLQRRLSTRNLKSRLRNNRGKKQKMTKRTINLISILFMLVLLIFLFPNVLAVTQEECENGGGELFTPQIASPDEGDFAKKELKPYCKCDTGFYWDTTSKICADDSKIRCIQTQGEWIEGECKCPEGTIKWTQGFGCDKEGPVPLGLDSKTDSESIKGGNSKITYLIIFIAGVLLSILFIFKRRRKIGVKNENKY